jgi:ATP adenylyltransferase
VERDMQMQHVYQPAMLRELLSRNGRATVGEIARALLNEERSQIEYYSEITKNMVGKLKNRWSSQVAISSCV